MSPPKITKLSARLLRMDTQRSVNILIALGADVTSLDNEALRWASLCGHTETVKILNKTLEHRQNTGDRR